MSALKRCFGLGWLLALAACAGGLVATHQSPDTFTSPSAQPTLVTLPARPAATATHIEIAPGPTPAWTPTLTPETTGMIQTQPITLTIVYDNNPFDARLKTAWGFACVVETDKTTILFDTGGDGPTLLGNLAALGFDPRRIDVVLLSHYHSDHTGGLDALLDADSHKIVYVPHSFPDDFKVGVSKRANVIEVSGPMTIASHIRTTGEMGTAIIEQSLLIETDKGLIVMTGCAHPGIVEIVRKAKEYGDVYMVIGGFHLKDKSASEVEVIIAALKQLGVRKVAPSHCTGDNAIRQFKEAFGQDFIPAGAGAVISAAQ
jgi:7,8-dihydropterin-6-yl-methyl-4-(beta-D-ribofuranosyl)aminobenzene 5'-phosphate synthase